MPDMDLGPNRIAVLASGLVYWIGVFVQIRRVRRKIGRSPNVKPRGAKEKVLWLGWFVVILAWLTMPFVVSLSSSSPLVRIIPFLHGYVGTLVGMALLVVGYAGTLWCYAAMGIAWRMGVNRAEKNRLVQSGPYQVIRHPIYLFQIVMLVGVLLLLPTLLAFLALAAHLFCISLKSADEEKFMLSIHGADYADYISRSGRFLPKLRLKCKS